MRSRLSLVIVLFAAFLLAGCSALDIGGPPSGTAPTPTPTREPTTEPTDTPEPTPTAEPTPEVFELSEAIDEGVVTARITGDGLQWIDVELTSKVDRPIEIHVELGTLFDPKARATQSMVLIQSAELPVEPLETDEWELMVACVEMRQHEPDSDDRFTLRDTGPKPALRELLELPAFDDEDFRVQQFSIWTITNNPRRSGYVNLGTSISIFGSGPSDDEMDAIRELFEAAGIDTADYRALR